MMALGRHALNMTSGGSHERKRCYLAYGKEPGGGLHLGAYIDHVGQWLPSK
ncbi:hypothetical protein D3C80_1412770 [compost metagenome]